ncbi:hypothetical protein SAY87_023879 [Trapa incisa]|uniref:PRA1 family protein n=1 Tax=Trapa incisa TaxID=236973 RepID=A0AAN7KTA1_9MYRT|nr:hypothetical protein SAY87_023879 [Trapa incisa]
MSSASPPISTTQKTFSATTAGGGSAQSHPPIATPAFRSFINNLTDSLCHGLSRCRPWSELADRSAFSKPESFSDATLRMRKNYSYFRVNYLTVVALIVGFSLATHPFSLLLLSGLLASWLFLYFFRPTDSPVVLFGRSYSDRETLGILIIFSIVVVFLTSVGSVLISAILAGVAVVCIHGSFRSPDDLFLDEPEPPATGFLSFLGNAASSAAAAAAPAAAPRV